MAATPLRPAFLWRLLRLGAVVAAIAGAAVFVAAPLSGHFSGEFEDFNAYLGAARASASHGDIYAAFLQQRQNVALSGFDYPPLVALLVTPLALLPLRAAATTWLLLDVAATLAGCIVVARTLLPATWPRTHIAVLAAFLYAAATYNLWHGQMNPVVFLLLALALRAWVRGEQSWCGAFVGAAAAIKLAPLVLVLLLLRRRWWQGATLAAALFLLSAAAGVLVFGVHSALEYVQGVLPVLGRGDGWMYNQSWDGVVNRLADHSVLAFQPDPAWLRAATFALSALGVLAATASVRAHRSDSCERGAEFGAGVIAMLLAGSITWYAQGVHLLIPFAATAGLLSVTRQRRSLAWSLGAAAFSYAVLAPLLIAVASMPRILALQQTPFWYPLLLLTSVPALSTAALLATSCLRLRARAAPLRRPQRVLRPAQV